MSSFIEQDGTFWNERPKSSNMQEIHDCNLEQPKPRRIAIGLSTTMCLVEKTLNTRPLTAISEDPEDLTALIPNHFLLGQKKMLRSVQVIQWALPGLQKFIENVSSIFQHDLEKMNSRIPSTMRPEIKVFKKHVQKLKKERICMARRCFFETLRVQAGTNL